MNIPAGDLNQNGADMDHTGSDQEIHSKDEGHVFDYFIVRLILCALYSLVFIICVLGNLAVVLVTALHSRMRNTTNFFLGHLAVANLCVGLFCIYQHLTSYLIETWIFGTFLCKMHYFTISLSQTASVLILVVTTVERYCVITHPFRSRYFLTFRQRQVIILIVWFSSAVLSFHKFYYVTTIEHRLARHDEIEIFCAMDVTNFNHKLADVIAFFLLFFLPLLAITILCTKAALYLREQGQQWIMVSPENMELNMLHTDITPLEEQDRFLRLNHHRRCAIRRTGASKYQRAQAATPRNSVETDSDINEGRQMDDLQIFETSSRRTSQSDQINGQPKSRYPMRNLIVLTQTPSSRPHASSGAAVVVPVQIRQQHLRVMKTLMAVASCFTLCNLPYYLQKILQNYFALYDSDNDWLELIPPITFLMMCLHCAINPFLHALLTRRFRTCLIEVVKCDRRRRRAHVSSIAR